jgi:hypothetical protein
MTNVSRSVYTDEKIEQAKFLRKEGLSWGQIGVRLFGNKKKGASLARVMTLDGHRVPAPTNSQWLNICSAPTGAMVVIAGHTWCSGKKNRWVHVAWNIPGKGWAQDQKGNELLNKNPTHWMPLPELPK